MYRKPIKIDLNTTVVSFLSTRWLLWHGGRICILSAYSEGDGLQTLWLSSVRGRSEAASFHIRSSSPLQLFYLGSYTAHSVLEHLMLFRCSHHFPHFTASARRQSKNVWQLFCDRFLKRPLLTVSRSFMNVANRVLWRMAIILKVNKVNLFVSSVLFVFLYNSPNFLDIPHIWSSL
jgi:hypothetical protein